MTIVERLQAMGFVKGTKEYERERKKIYYWANREKCLARKKHKYATDPVFVERERERNRKYYHKPENKKRILAKCTTWQRENAERRRERVREWWHRNKRSQLAKVFARRKGADPTYGLRKAINDCRAGRITIAELDRLYRESFIQLNEGSSQQSAGSRSKVVRPR